MAVDLVPHLFELGDLLLAELRGPLWLRGPRWLSVDFETEFLDVLFLLQKNKGSVRLSKRRLYRRLYSSVHGSRSLSTLRLLICHNLARQDRRNMGRRLGGK